MPTLHSLHLIFLTMTLAACTVSPAGVATSTVMPPPSVSTQAQAVTLTPTIVPSPTGAPRPQVLFSTNTPVPTQSPMPPTPTRVANPSGVFVPEEVNVTGGYTLDLVANTLRFSADFAIPPGPDLYVILSGASDLTLHYLDFSKQVINTPQLNLGELQKQVGAQDYPLPAGADLSLYKTVVVWCQAFSVAFAAAPLTLP